MDIYGGVWLRILAFSDVAGWWKGYEALVDSLQPDVICLAGDLVSDGFAEFLWGRGRRTDHVESFYKFLQRSGSVSKVLVVKGNHDEDFEEDYSPERINEIPGCFEISGRTIEVDGMLFLGLGFREARRLRSGYSRPSRYLQSLIEKFRGKVDVVLMHDKNIRYASLLKPKLIIKGGLCLGACLVNGVPSVFTGPDSSVIIEFENKAISKISGYLLNPTRWYVEMSDSRGIRKAFSLDVPVNYRKFEWVKPLAF